MHRGRGGASKHKSLTSKEYDEEKYVAADQGFLQPVPVTTTLNFGRFNASPRGKFICSYSKVEDSFFH
jgi:hypothetical protein